MLHAYFNVCSRRIMDNVCMVVEDKLLQTIGAAIEMELVNTLQGQEDVRDRGCLLLRILCQAVLAPCVKPCYMSMTLSCP